MSLTLTYDQSVGGPIGVYSDNFIVIHDTSVVNYIEIDVSYNHKLKTQRLYQDGSLNAYIDVNKIMEDSFESLSTDPENKIFSYSLAVRSYHSDDIILSTESDVSTWVINGIKDNYDFYLINDTNKSYLDNYSSKPKFLNDQVINYLDWDISLYDLIGAPAVNELNLYILNGDKYRGNTNSGSISFIDDFEIVKYEGDSSTAYSLDVATVGTEIKSIPIDPAYLNLNVPDLSINNLTTKYTIRDDAGSSETITVQMREPNTLNDKYFRLGWINKNGVLNYYNFDYNYLKTLQISRKTFQFLSHELQQYTRQFNTEASEVYNITTGWIKEEDSKILEGLWVSPNVKVSAFYSRQSDYNKDFIQGNLIWNNSVILNVSNMEIKKRLNRKLINYSIDIIIGKDYKIQKY